MAIALEQRSLELVDIGRVTGRHLILIVERYLMSIDGDRYGCWGEVSPKALVVVDGRDAYTYPFQDPSPSLGQLREDVDGLDEMLLSLQMQV